MHGGNLAASVLKAQGIEFLFTLCGGHISPILVGARRLGIRVIDVRDEAAAVFAADAAARLTGRPAAAAVTAGPGATNTITALKNAQMAQSPLVLLVGATAAFLKGRGALQDIDQRALLRPHVKSFAAVSRVRDLPAVLEAAFRSAREGVPGPAAVEIPVDLLYPEETVRGLYGLNAPPGPGLAARAIHWRLRRGVGRLFAGAGEARAGPAVPDPRPELDDAPALRAAHLLARAERPLLLAGSQAAPGPQAARDSAAAITGLGIPVYLSSMARGLLGRRHPLLFRHERRKALREADLIVLAGVPCDFRLDYGRHMRRSAVLIAANRHAGDLRRNRRPHLAVRCDPAAFLRQLAACGGGPERWPAWKETLRKRDAERQAEIERQADAPVEPAGLVNPLRLLAEIDRGLPDDAVVVADGGDFVGSASYILHPPGPLSWLDPGPFGTLGAGAGFALGARLVRPQSETWLLYGDGAAGYSLQEFDTFVRHRIPVIAVVGNDASWRQIAREQVGMLGDDTGTVLRRTDYHRVAEGFGGKGLLLDDPARIPETLAEARRLAAAGEPVLINAHIGNSDFRKGSISL